MVSQSEYLDYVGFYGQTLHEEVCSVHKSHLQLSLLIAVFRAHRCRTGAQNVSENTLKKCGGNVLNPSEKRSISTFMAPGVCTRQSPGGHKS